MSLSRSPWRPDVVVIDTIDAWRKVLDAERTAGHRVGLVPTMGALHAGHASLIQRAAAECEVVATTIFVNPLQFGEDEDLASYPRSLAADVALAEASGSTHVFAPAVAEMYPAPGPGQTVVSVPALSTRFEGASRPGHLDGVATVVAKLFSQAGACRAYFGEKDYQQLCVVRRMAADLDLPVTMVACPTVRDPDGLAVSSRNAHLTPAQRVVAPKLHRALRSGAAALGGGRHVDEARRAMYAAVAAEPAFTLIYAEPVDPETLEPLTGVLAPGASGRLLIAALLGRTRLIDNLGVTR